MKISEIDVEQRVDELLLSQYADSENLKKYIKCFVRPIQANFHALDDSQRTRAIAESFGDSTDKIAKTVGEERIIRGAAALGYFGFKDTPDGEPFNVGIFYSYGDKQTGDLVLSDNALKSLIRARIVLNTSGGRIEDIIQYTELLVGRPVDIEIKEGTASLDIFIHEDLDASERLLLSLRMYHIIPIGVSLHLRDNNSEITVEAPNK